MNKRSRGGLRAFTLIEIMVALFLLGLVVAAVYSSWMAIIRGSKVGLKAAAEVQRSRVAMRTLEDALTCARSFTADYEYYGFIAENGTDASLSFVARLPESFPRSGKFGDLAVRRVTFSLEQGLDSQRELVLRQNPLLMDLDVDEQEHPVVLAKDVKKFEMEFWDGRSQDWLDEWTQTNQLPQMVKLTLQFGGAATKAGSELTRVVALPSMAVAPVLQVPGMPPRPAPGLPGIIRPGQPPIQPGLR